jgi:hypothetical protein
MECSMLAFLIHHYVDLRNLWLRNNSLEWRAIRANIRAQPDSMTSGGQSLDAAA